MTVDKRNQLWQQVGEMKRALSLDREHTLDELMENVIVAV